jgi:hypothetical protein
VRRWRGIPTHPLQTSRITEARAGSKGRASNNCRIDSGSHGRQTVVCRSIPRSGERGYGSNCFPDTKWAALFVMPWLRGIAIPSQELSHSKSCDS